MLDALRRHCEDTREFGALAEALALHLAAASDSGRDPVELARVHLELGDLHRNHLHDPDRALKHFSAAIELDGAQRAAIVGARELLAATGSWVQVAELWARDAELSPAGPKRAAALLELASVYEHRLGRRTRAAWTLRDAVAAGADDLHVLHHLATLLLDEAERTSDPDEVARMHDAAADALVTMAGHVTDDYALAYLESALDAVADHEPALVLLDEVAPRMGRADVLAPRWLSAIRAARSPALARTLRLKMAHAYLAVAQHRDARICLEPLLAAGDQEAIELGALLQDTGSRPAVSAQARTSRPPSTAEVADEGSSRRQRTPTFDDDIADDATTPRHEGFEALAALDEVDEVSALDGEPTRPRESEPPQQRNTMLEAAALEATPLTVAELSAITGAPLSVPGPDPEDETTHDDRASAELRELRAELAKRLRFRDRRGAAEIAESLLERGVFDPVAIEALEEHFRLGRDFRRMRDLSLRLGRVEDFSVETRSTRLREAVMLSETKLGDPEGAAEALEELLRVEPADHDAFHKLKRLHTRAQAWDKLAALLDRRAAAEGERAARAAILRELGALERDMRQAPVQAIAAFAAARAFDPGRDDDDVALTALYLTTQRYPEAAATLEARLERARPFESAPLLASLAKIYEENLHDLTRTQRVLARWREVEPHKPEVLEALIRVLDLRGDHAALAEALRAKVEIAPAAERAKLHARIAELALGPLNDPVRAAEAYADAIEAAPHDSQLWSAAEPAFARAGRSKTLDRLLWELALEHRDRPLAAAVLDHLAVTRGARSDVAGAIEAREAQLAATQERDVLEKLVELLRAVDRPSDLGRRLDELARRSEPAVARPLRLERAGVLAQKLDDAAAAKAELERLLTELAPDDTAALKMLVDLCAATGDVKRRASAQERLLKLAPSLGARIALAVELVDIYEHELGDLAGATRVLLAWAHLEPNNPQPLLRLLPLLTHAGQKPELLAALDKLGKLAMADDEAGELVLRAARVALELEDHEGAWNRLVPRVAEKNEAAAEALLHDVARIAGRGDQLAALFVGLAQRAKDPAHEKKRWVDASHVYEELVGAPDRALEAMLRALARELDSSDLLAEVERLVERANAWPRLVQVYDALVRRAPQNEVRKRLLMRHAHLLETRAYDAKAAFERAWLAYQLDAADDHVYAETVRLGGLAGRTDILLLTHERRAQANVAVRARIDALLDGCALAFPEQRPRAIGYVTRAVALAADHTELLERIEHGLRALDAKHPPVDGRGLLAELADAYGRLADEQARAPKLAACWLQRAARLHEVTLGDHDASYRALERATTHVTDEKLLDDLQRAASLAGAWDALATHLQHIADAAIDSRGSSMALRRLAALCERQLSNPSRAADAYEQLVRLTPGDAEAAARLRACLRDAHRFEELLIAIDRELFLLRPEDDRAALLKQAAEAWEFGIKNRYEALDAWTRVVAVAPDDADAQTALTRLRARPRTDDALLLDGDLVVRPEDLRPSVESDDLVDDDLDASSERATDAGSDAVDADDDELQAAAAAHALAPSPAETAELRDALAAFDAHTAAAPELAVSSLEGLSALVSQDDLVGSHARRIVTPPPPPPSGRRR